MLIINRKVGQTIILTGEMPPGEEIRITVVARNGKWINLGVDAPKSIKITRLERERDARNQQAVSDDSIRAEDRQTGDEQRRPPAAPY